MFVAALAALSLQAAAQPATPAPAPGAVKTPVSSPATAAGDKIVCKIEATNGQRITRRVCRTAAEWDVLTRGAEAYLWDRREKASLRGY